MLTLIQTGFGLPISYPLDPSATFQPGNIGQLKLMGQDIVVGLSDGSAPFGVIDDVRTSAFTQPVYDEVVVIESNGTYTDGYNFFTERAAKQELENANLNSNSFVSDYEGLILNPINGVLTLPADSILNYDNNGDGKNDSVKAICNYVYEVPSLAGDDTTIGSNRITIWFQRAIFATDQYDTLQRYPLNATLFVNEQGKLTTQQLTANHPGIGIVLGPPNNFINTLEFLWL